MRALGLLLLGLLSIPLAGALDVAAGGAHVFTANTDAGTCSDANGSQDHRATATVANPFGPGGTTASAWSTCGSYSYVNWWCPGTSSGQYAYDGASFEDNRWGSGLAGGAGWYEGHGQETCTSTSYKYCGSYATLSGVNLYPGCPSPVGSPPPMAPELP